MAEEWDVFSLPPGDSASPPTLLATLYNAREKSIRLEEDATGSGQFAINRTSPECTEAILAKGNLVKVRIPEISTGYTFAFFLETGDFTLISSDEAGGEMLHFGGRGNLCYLERAVAWNESFLPAGHDPIAGIWRAYAFGGGNAPGQILWRTLVEMTHADRPQHPLAHLTIDFDEDVDSDGETWLTTPATSEFSYPVGETGMEILERLLETDRMHVWMGPDFDFHAYNDTGRDLTGAAFGAGVVRFERGVNIAVELRRATTEDRVITDDLVQGENNTYDTARLRDADERVTKEGFLAAFGTELSLEAQGRVDLNERLDVSETITFQINNRRTADVVLSDPVSIGSPQAVPGLATAGYYLPGPDGTNGDFWLGDTVTVHTGSGAFDFNEAEGRVVAITISREDDNAELIVIPEIRFEPPTSPAYGILYRVDTNANVSPDGVPRQLNWGRAGDNPFAGYPVRPTVGLIEPILDPAPYDSAYPHIGWRYLGDGTVDVVVVASYIGVLVGAKGFPASCTVTLQLLLNGTPVTGAVATRRHSGFLQSYAGVIWVSMAAVAGVATDELTATLSLTGTPSNVTTAKVAFATGQNGERFEITGGALT